jgi:DNA polymerase
MTIHIDIETRSPIDITKAGVHTYAEQVEVLIACWAIDDGPVQTWTILDGPPLSDYLPTDGLYAAHNSQFERVCLKENGIDIPIEQWDCTATRARAMNLPASLAGAATALELDYQKDKRGMALIRKFSIPPYQEPNAEDQDWLDFVAYCQQDVEVERALDKALQPLKQSEVWHQDQRINDRAIYVDQELVAGAIKIDTAHRVQCMDRLRTLTRLDNPNSQQQLLAWFKENGVKINNLRKDTVQGLDQSKYSPEIGEVITLRQQLSQTSSKKYQSMKVSSCDDGAIRGILQYNGAGQTGRWAGRRVQPQNLARGIVPVTTDFREAIKTGDLDWLATLYGDNVQGLLGSALRSALIPPEGQVLLISDYSAIEARVLAWLAGEEWVLEEFRGEGKIYEATAAKMYNVKKDDVTKPQRQNGKGATLGCGFGGGVGAVQAFGIEEGIAQKVVNDWRAANPSIVKYWRKCMTAAKRGGVVDTKLPKVEYKRTKKYLMCRLPSGRVLYYPNARPSNNGFDMDGKNVWHGILVENVCQAVARDLLAHALLECEKEGFDVRFHVHDEIVCYGQPEELEKLEEVMCRLPDWAKGIPMNAEGEVSPWYKK